MISANQSFSFVSKQLNPVFFFFKFARIQDKDQWKVRSKDHDSHLWFAIRGPDSFLILGTVGYIIVGSGLVIRFLFFRILPTPGNMYLSILLTIRKGWLVVLKTLLSVKVWATSSFWMITSFFNILIAYKWPDAFSRQRITLPNVPLPSTFKNSKFSNVWKHMTFSLKIRF